MLDWQGNLNPPSDRQKILLPDIEEDTFISNTFAVGKIEARVIVDLLDNTCTKHPLLGYDIFPKEVDELVSTYAKISPLLYDAFLHDALHQECMYSKYKFAIGATYVKGEANLISI